MTLDFWVLLIVLAITFLVSAVLAFIVNPLYGIVNIIPAALIYAWALWSQYCLRAGNCTTLAWLTVALWVIYCIVIITVMSIALYLVRKARKQQTDRTEHRDERRGERRGEREHRGEDRGEHRDKREGFYYADQPYLA
jgi:uncharacterized membrane protein